AQGPLRAGGPPPPEGEGVWEGRARVLGVSGGLDRGDPSRRVCARHRPAVSVDDGGGSQGSPSPENGTPIDVTIGTPSLHNLTCEGGGAAYAERIPWMNSSSLLTTKSVWPEVYETWDRNNIRDPDAV